MECIFCEIAKKNIQSKIVLETEKIIVIEDISPQAPTHLLLVPKAHYATLLECSDRELLSEFFIVAKEAAKKAGVDEKGFRLVVNTNDEGGQVVRHLHMHLMAGRALSGKMG